MADVVVAGAAGLLLTFLGMAISPRPALLAYLVAYVFWLGLAIGAVALVMANHATGARWNVTIRRFGETEPRLHAFVHFDAENSMLMDAALIATRVHVAEP